MGIKTFIQIPITILLQQHEVVEPPVISVIQKQNKYYKNRLISATKLLLGLSIIRPISCFLSVSR